MSRACPSGTPRLEPQPLHEKIAGCFTHLSPSVATIARMFEFAGADRARIGHTEVISAPRMSGTYRLTLCIYGECRRRTPFRTSAGLTFAQTGECDG